MVGEVDVIRPPEGSVLDRRTLNRTLLARQRLLRRRPADLAETIEYLVGMQAQVPIDPFISLWSRLEAFDPAGLDRLLLDRAAVRMTLLRGTLHLVTARDALGLRPPIQDVAERSFRSSPFWKRLEGIDLDALLRSGTELLETTTPTTAELGDALAQGFPGRDPDSLAYAVRYLVPSVQITPRGLFRRSAAPRLATLRAWLGRDAEAGQPVEEIALRYLRAFGPATTSDMRTWSWFAGLRDVFETLRPQLCSYRDESGRELFDVMDGEFADPDTPAPVRFLGEYDNVFLSHADRTRITGDLAWGGWYAHWGSFYVDGLLAGRWRLRSDRSEVRIEIEPARALDAEARVDVRAEAESVAAFLSPDAAATVDIAE